MQDLGKGDNRDNKELEDDGERYIGFRNLEIAAKGVLMLKQKMCSAIGRLLEHFKNPCFVQLYIVTEYA